jgi:hypothetical protein
MLVWAQISISKLPDFNWFVYFFTDAQDLFTLIISGGEGMQSRNISLSLGV